MGVTFRSGSTIKFVRLGGRTIKDGEAAAIWTRYGEHQQIVGPQRVILFYSTIRFLDRFKAEQDQYLQIKHRDGSVEHIPGPISMYRNPTWHDSIKVKNGIPLNVNQVVLVKTIPIKEISPSSKENNKEESKLPMTDHGQHSNRFVRGPTLFIPLANERVCDFNWTNTTEDLLVPVVKDYDEAEVGRFQAMELNTHRIWKIKVPMKTSDFVKFQATLAITYKIVSESKCASVGDPIASLAASLMADGRDLASHLAGKDLKSNASEISNKLSQLSSFTNLVKTAEKYGFSVDAILLQGIKLDEVIQADLDEEQRRTRKLTQDMATKENNIRLQVLDLEEKRKKMENHVELSRNEAQLQAELAEEAFHQKIKALEREAELGQREQEIQLKAKKQDDESVLSFLRELKGLDVDMSDFLCTAGGRSMTSKVLHRSLALSAIPRDEGVGRSQV